MNKFLSLLTFDNITEGVKKAYEKYKAANSSFWVTSLSFNTILAISPIFAILFSLGSWFGAKDYIIEQIIKSTPLPKETIELISTFAENALKNARSGIIAGVGFLFLGWTLITTFTLIERSFNDIWHIKIPRTLIRKVSDYISFFYILTSIIYNIKWAFIVCCRKGRKYIYSLSFFIKNSPIYKLTFIFCFSLYSYAKYCCKNCACYVFSFCYIHNVFNISNNIYKDSIADK